MLNRRKPRDIKLNLAFFHEESSCNSRTTFYNILSVIIIKIFLVADNLMIVEF